MSQLQESEMGSGEIVDWRALPSLPLSDRRKLPNCKAVYFVTSGDDLLYIGQATSLVIRWLHHKVLAGLTAFENVMVWWMETDRNDIRKFEAKLIYYMKPLLNKRIENPFNNQYPDKPATYEHVCQRPTCRHIWQSKFARPVVCPRCKSYSWDVKPTTKGRGR